MNQNVQNSSKGDLEELGYFGPVRVLLGKHYNHDMLNLNITIYLLNQNVQNSPKGNFEDLGLFGPI